MADFIAVIRRAVDGLSSNTPEMRARVYEKARAAVVRQLEGMQPRPPEHMLQRQLEKLDAAIRDVEAEHATAEASAPLPVEEPAPTVTGDDWADAYMAEPEPKPDVQSRPEPVAPPEAFAPWQTPGGNAEAAEPSAPSVAATSFDEGRHPAEPDIEDYPAPSAATSETWSPPSPPAVPLWEQREARYQEERSPADLPAAPYDDWQGAPTTVGLPSAEWNHPDLLETAANRVPELPELDTQTAHPTHMPMDEFPPFQEPADVQTGMEFGGADRYPVPHDPQAFGTVAGPGAQVSSEPDDFSQWFQDHAGGVNEHADAAAAPDFDGRAAGVAGVAGAAAPAKNDAMDALMGGYDQPAYRLEPRRRRNFAPVILAALGFTIAAGAGIAGWVYRDSFSSMFTNVAGEPVQTTAGGNQPAANSGGAAVSDTTQEAANGGEAPAAAGAEKFTQRLQSDGTEVDAGAAAAPSIGTPPEGRSVSAQTLASNIEGTNAAAATAAQNAASPAASTTAAAGGDKLFLYEEQIGQATPVAVPGGVTWTALRENGADGRPDPQIQGRLSIPDRGISALLTIKRNTDDSLPASHLIEVVFSVPSTFEGGAIESLQRIAMKRTEQDRGDPLVAVTAKVTDDTYLVALNDFEDVIARNMELLSTRGWIDIPVVYRNGRRALITMDKGADGAKVFDEVIREWKALGPGN